MKRRCEDLPYHAFSPSGGITVACPRCGGAGTVCLERERAKAVFRCGSCRFQEETAASGDSFAQVTGQCPSTGRRFRVFVPREKIRGPKKRVRCPCCGEPVLGEVFPPDRPPVLVLEEVRQGLDPYFHYPLYFQGSFRGKLVWALNREHLRHLIDYLSADLRTVPAGFRKRYKTMRSQADQLPSFMKSAKNREGIVKLLTKLQAR